MYVCMKNVQHILETVIQIETWPFTAHRRCIFLGVAVGGQEFSFSVYTLKKVLYSIKNITKILQSNHLIKMISNLHIIK